MANTARNTLVFAGCLCTLFVAWWMYDRGSNPTLPGPPDPVGSSPKSDPTNHVSTVTRDDQTRKPPTTKREAIQAPPEATPAPRAQERSPDAPTVRLRVVHGKTKTPVPGAEVFYQDPAYVENLRQLDPAEQRRLMRDPFALLTRYGTRLVADGDGVVRIPDDGSKYVFAVGRRDDLVGMALVEPDYATKDGIYELAIGVRILLRAKVVDSAGRPVEGASVHVLGRYGEGRRRSIIQLGQSSKAGLAQSHLPLTLLEGRGRSKAKPTDTAIAVKILGGATVEVRIDLQSPPEGAVLLEVPATGRLEVKVTAPDGGPWTSGPFTTVAVEIGGKKPWHSVRRDTRGVYVIPMLALGKQCKVRLSAEQMYEERQVVGPTQGNRRVVVEIQEPESGRILVTQTSRSGRTIPMPRSTRVTLREPGRKQRFHGRRDGDGRLVFHHVPLGRTFAVSLGEGPDKIVTGPRTHREDVTVEIPVDGGTVFVSGRALDEHGKPFAGRKIRISGGIIATVTRTDADGCFSAAAQPMRGKGRGNRAGSSRRNSSAPVVLALVNRREQPTGESCEIPDLQLLPGEHKFGDVTLRMPGLVVLAEIVGGVHPSTLSFSLQRLESYTVRGRARERWRSDRGITRVNRRDNHVEYRGITAAGRYRLRVSGSDILPLPPLEFAPGAKDLKIKVVRGGRLTAVIRTDQGIQARTLWVVLEHVRGELPDDAPAPFFVLGAGQPGPPPRDDAAAGGQLLHYEWRGLWPGTYRLCIRPLGTANPLRVIEAIEIIGGKPAPDRRLAEVDIRGTTQLVAITLQTPAGGPLPWQRNSPLLVRRGAGPDAFDCPVPDPKGCFLIAKTAGPLSVVVCAREYRGMEIRGITEDTVIELKPLYRVHVTLAGGGPTLPQGKNLTLSMTWVGRPPKEAMVISNRGTERLDRFLSGSVKSTAVGDGKATLAVRQSGEYLPRAWIRETDNRRFRRALELPDSVRWRVRDVDGVQEFDLAIPQRLVDAALEK
jgi:hypothetical protein